MSGRVALNENVARNAQIAALAERGAAFCDIARLFGVTGARVRGIVRREQRRAEKEAAVLALYGCTREQFMAIRTAPGAPLTRFTRQKLNAEERGIGWDLTLSQWWAIWQESGHWHERGRGRGRYVMARIGDVGPYAVGNVVIAPFRANCSEAAQTRVRKRLARFQEILEETQAAA